MDLKNLKVELQSFGVKRGKDITGGRAAGAGPAGSITFLIGKSLFNVPFAEHTGRESKYYIEKDNTNIFLSNGKSIISEIKLIPQPSFYNKETQTGIPYNKIALLHGTDCLATTIIQKCDYWAHGKQCKFCAIEYSAKSGATTFVKTPNELSEIAVYAKENDGIKHITLTSGSSNNQFFLTNYLAECIQRIKESSGLPVHIQITPDGDFKESLHKLKEAGADTVGIHIESFDDNVRKTITPAKYSFSINTFKEAWAEAVTLFGKNQVSSFIITGIGESMQSVIEGSELLAEAGVYPLILPLHPIPGTKAFPMGTPDSDYQDKLYTSVSRITRKYGLHSDKSKAGCIRCTACSAMKEYEDSINEK